MTLQYFPIINATLNGASAVLLAVAFVLIKSGRIRAHAYTMIAALVTSTIFLACYLTYHGLKAQRGDAITRFPPGPVRPIYFTILISHTVLAVVILPLIAVTLWRAYRRQWSRHRKISSVTLPLWFYVSVTGVIVYWMLYHLAPRLGSHKSLPPSPVVVDDRVQVYR